ncbi:MAG TPA: S26 family signal peptidase [Candidatus Limnocylindrales bacterium]|nr:S26 family signal peptidase [Candidatus Limnocylindrales bacterium]
MGLRRIRGRARLQPVRERARGPWRVVVSEASMAPTIQPGDWLLVDPTTARWPRRGAIVVFREPDSDLLAIKRVAAGPGARVDLDEGHLVLAADEAWLLSDASDADLLAAGAGQPIDSRRYGPVPVEALVGRVWFRYGPIDRIGPVRRPSAVRR